jgi:HAD superfamily hydrolase (TIGR01509 family)
VSPAPAIIFDCDGVLIDSERVGCQVDARELATLGIAITPEALAHRFSGVSYRDMYHALEREHGIAVPADYAARAHARVLAACAAEGAALAMPGIHALLDGLGDRVRAVVSSSDHDWLRRTLDQVDLWRRFAPHVYSALEVTRGKPAPDLFIHAAGRLGAAAVFDDMAALAAALRAGA